VAKSAARPVWGWLFKEEPEHYSFADLERDRETTWDGISNALALQHLRKVKKGDRILFYHTGKEKAVVGVMRAVGDAAGADKLVSVQVKAEKRLAAPVPLAALKKEPDLKDWELIRLPRLSVMPVSAEQWNRIEALSKARV
jgi:predicted RNA-binding protein with PUA-like domain